MNQAMKQAIKIAAAILLMVAPTFAQVQVALAPMPKLQFLSNSGTPLAGGCVFFFAAGTSTPQAAFTDSTGTISLTNPLILDAGGFSSPNGIWLSSSAYKIQLKSAGGVNCASGTQQWTVDNVSSVLGLLSLPNTWTQQQTFTQPILVTPTTNQVVLGTAPGLTTLNFPAPGGAVTLTFPNSTTIMVGRNTTDTLTNKTLTNPSISGMVFNALTIPSTAGLGTYELLTNDTVTGTANSLLAKLSAGKAITATVADTTGIIGIPVSGAGISGSVTVQMSGAAQCTFDNAQVAGDYVVVSTTNAGDCHDAGATYPSSGVQVVGRALCTGGASTCTLDLFGHEIRGTLSTSVPVIASNLTGQTANVTNIALLTPSVNGFYRFSCFVVETTNAVTSSTLPSCQVNFTDADSSTVLSIIATNTNATNTVGSIGQVITGANANAGFFAKAGAAITYSTTGYASNVAATMAYAVHVRLEGPF